MTGSASFGDATINAAANTAPLPGPGERAHFLVYEQDSSSAFYLPDDGEIVVGRGPDCAIRVSDMAASRQHARVAVTRGEVWITDLGSHNGTQLGGERLTSPRRLRAGDLISIGGTTLVFYGAPHARDRGVVTAAVFRERLEEEIERAVRYRRPVAILVGHLPETATSDVARAVVRPQLRLLDVLAFEGTQCMFVLLPEVDAREAGQRGKVLGHVLAAARLESRFGLAVCPDDGCEADALVSGAVAAAAQAEVGQLLRLEDTTSHLEIGGKRIVAADPATQRLFALVRRLAASELSVLVHGETGAGKEIAAWALHHWSPRRLKPLRTLNCAALQETLLESELFGHERGAFTGAVGSKPGLLEMAHGGTMFLDEVGELSPQAQAKLLRALETKRVTRLGDVHEREIDIRLVSATNRSLADEVKAGRFREDLFYRLNGATVMVPPLRSRQRELIIMARTFLDETRAREGRHPLELSAPVVQALGRHPWPGNIRELRHAMDYVSAMTDGDTVEIWHLPDGLRPTAEVSAPPSLPAGDTTEVGDTTSARMFRPIGDEVRDLERLRMVEALAATGGVQARAAALIGMPLRTFMAKMKIFNLRPPRLPEDAAT